MCIAKTGLVFCSFLSCLLVVAACGGTGADAGAATVGGAPTSPGPETGETPQLTGGVLATIGDGGESFRVWVTNPAAAQLLVDAWNGAAPFEMITGPLRRGAGDAAHNAPWSWHLDPEQVQVNVHLFRAVYAGPPSQVEANLESLLAAGEDKMTIRDQAVLQDVRDQR